MTDKDGRELTREEELQERIKDDLKHTHWVTSPHDKYSYEYLLGYMEGVREVKEIFKFS